jgi:hypothetical protein
MSHKAKRQAQAQAKLEAMLLAGDASGDGSEVNREFWQMLKTEIIRKSDENPQ